MSGTLVGNIALSRRCPDRCAPPPPCELNNFLWCICTYEQAPTTVPRITTASLPAGRVGVAYGPVTLAATNSPTGWAITSGTLPAGLTFNTTTGEISGTPTAAASVNLTFSATNADGTGTRTLRMTVAAAPAVVMAAHYGPIPNNVWPSPPGHPVESDILALPSTNPNPVKGTVMVAPHPIGAWGKAFAYPASLGPAASVIDSVAGNVTSAYNRAPGDSSGESPLTIAITGPSGPVDYLVYYIRSAIAAPAAGTTATLTI